MKNGVKMFNDNLLKEQNTMVGYQRFKIGDGIQKPRLSITDDQHLREWVLCTLHDVR
jgi:hypothetical protein